MALVVVPSAAELASSLTDKAKAIMSVAADVSSVASMIAERRAKGHLEDSIATDVGARYTELESLVAQIATELTALIWIHQVVVELGRPKEFYYADVDVDVGGTTATIEAHYTSGDTDENPFDLFAALDIVELSSSEAAVSPIMREVTSTSGMLVTVNPKMDDSVIAWGATDIDIYAASGATASIKLVQRDVV